MERVSIIIPVYKNAQWLRKCIDSCIKQLYENVEIILIDDGSPDCCGDVCDEYAREDTNIKVIHQENQGVSAARNAGIRMATGEYIAFVDSDDIVDIDMIGALVRNMQASSADLVIGGYNSVQKDIVVATTCLPKATFVGKQQIMEHLAKIGFGRTVWGKLFARKIIEENGLQFDVKMKLGEDYCFLLNYLTCINSVITISEVIYNYRLPENNKSSQYQGKDLVFQWNNDLHIHECFVSAFIKTGMYDQIRETVDLEILQGIRRFINDMQVYHNSRSDIIKVLKSFKVTLLYKEICKLPIKCASSLVSRFILLCVKHQMWSLLYLAFMLKNRIVHKV